MKSLAFKIFSSISLGLALLSGADNVNAGTYRFYQGGFPDGGYVKGSFSGQDKYGGDGSGVNLPGYEPDGIITVCSGRSCPFPNLNEISEFSIHFGGNLLFEGINALPEGGLTGLAYDIQASNLSFSYGSCDTSCFPYWAYSNGLIQIPGDRGETLFFSGTQSLQISQVPLPGALGLFFAGMLPLYGLLRKKRRG